MGPITYLVPQGSHGPTFCPSGQPSLSPSAHTGLSRDQSSTCSGLLDYTTHSPPLVLSASRPLGEVCWGLHNRMHSVTPSAQLPTGPCGAPALANCGLKTKSAVFPFPNTRSHGTWSQSDTVAMAAVCEQQYRWRQRGPRTYKSNVWPSHCVPSNPSPCPPQASMTSTGSCETLQNCRTRHFC